MKIRGNTVGFPNPQPDWEQTDPLQADYIRNKPDVVGAGGPVVSGELAVESQKYTMTLTLADNSTDVIVLETDADDYPTKVTVNGTEIPWTVTGV